MGLRHLVVLVALLGVARSAMILTSREFNNYELIPGFYGCDIVTGKERDPYKPSPPLFWTRPPAKVQSYVLMVDDIDNDGFVHWLVANIPRDVTSLEADASIVAMPEGAVEYPNSYNALGWGGPCPLGEKHRYRFRMFALDVPSVNLTLPENVEELRAPFITAQLDRALYVAVLAGDYYCPKYVEEEVEIKEPPPDRVIPPQPEPIPIYRYFKPSESFRKKGKIQGVYDNIPKVECESGTDKAQLCKPPVLEEPHVEALRAPFFPPAPQPIDTLQTISTDPPSEMSDAEKAKHHVRPGGLELVNSQRGGIGLIVPIQTDPNINAPKPIALHKMPESSLGEEMLVQEDFEVLQNKTAEEVEALTKTLQKTTAESGCQDCQRGFIPPPQRRYYLALGSPIFFEHEHNELPQEFACDPANENDARVSIPFLWKRAPPKTGSFVLMVDEVFEDVDSPDFGKVLWLVANIRANETSISLGASGSNMPEGAQELENSFGKLGYTAPCPQDRSTHKYRARLFAMAESSIELKLEPSYRSIVVEKQIHPIITASMELTFTNKQPTKRTGLLQRREPAANSGTQKVADVIGEGAPKVVEMDGPAGPKFFDLSPNLMNEGFGKQ